MFNLLAEAVSVTIPTPDLSGVPTGGWIGMGAAVWYSVMAVMFRRGWSERIVKWNSEGRHNLAYMDSGDKSSVAAMYLVSPVLIPIIAACKGVCALLIKQPKGDKA